MNEAGTASLYTPELLGLAVSLARYPTIDQAEHVGEARSRTCGSTATVSFELDRTARIARAGLRVSACAIGQAAAAIFADGAIGRDRTEIERALAQLESWLGGGPEPDWPGFVPLAPARAHPGRHGALLLPWRAALAALPKADRPG